MSHSPRLRSPGSPHRGPYPLGQLPDKLLYDVARHLVHRMAVGLDDLTGDDWGNIFANAIGGEHRQQPVGVADVSWDGCAWSLKTVKRNSPFSTKSVRLISGRNNIGYSLGMDNRIVDPAATGDAVLSIWNSRVNQAMGEFDDLRVLVLVRNWQSREFLIWEEEARRYVPQDFAWSVNTNGNLVGNDKPSGFHRFTWQPNGAQFTIIREVPISARKFRIASDVPAVNVGQILDAIGYSPEWVDVVD